MIDAVTLSTFVAASLALLLLPGPGVLFVATQSAAFGIRAGLTSTFGLSLGAFVHVIAATLGLSALMLASATAFGVIKTIGAAYLIYLGLRMVLARSGDGEPGRPKAQPLHRMFFDGVMVSVFNPKIVVFFLAYLPHFVDPGAGSVAAQIMLLGTLYCLLAILTDGLYALGAASLRDRLTASPRVMRVARYLGGSLFVGLGVQTALAQRTN